MTPLEALAVAGAVATLLGALWCVACWSIARGRDRRLARYDDEVVRKAAQP